jgi:hypothetical protein
LSSLDVIDVIVEALQGLIQRGQAPETATLLCDAHDWWLDGGLFSDAINTVFLPFWP